MACNFVLCLTCVVALHQCVTFFILLTSPQSSAATSKSGHELRLTRGGGGERSLTVVRNRKSATKELSVISLYAGLH